MEKDNHKQYKYLLGYQVWIFIGFSSMNIFGKYLIGIWYEYQNVQWQAILGLTSTFGFMIQPHISSLLNSIKYPFLVSRRQREPRGRQMLGLAAQHSQELSRINVSNFHGKCRLFLPSLSISIGIMAATWCPSRRGGVPDEAEKIEIWHKSQPHWAINRGMGTLRTYSDETSICFKDYKYFTISLKNFFQFL